MPSIPQSLLWISLVVLWLFVLVPMLISRRDTVRRTSDVALATRVVNTGRGARLLRRTGPAAGHHSDPHWRPAVDDRDEFKDDEHSDDVADVEAEPLTAPNKVVVLAAAVVHVESKYLDVDIVEEDSGALPIGVSAGRTSGVDKDPQLPLDFDDRTQTFSVDDLSDIDDIDDTHDVEPEDALDEELAGEADPVTDSFAASEDDDYDYEYVDDSSGLEMPSDTDVAGSASHARRDRFETKTAAAVSARKFEFRKRLLMAMAVLLLASAVAAYLVTPTLWWVCGTVGVITVLYLAYLRRQTRIEAKLRRRRAQRMMRSRLGVENTRDREFDVVPARLRRPGSVVLEIDDEDPIFEHLDDVPFARDYVLPHAAGQ